jgi:DDE family transposase
MLGKEARCRNRQRDLRQFLNRFCPSLDKTRQRFLRQAIWAVLMSNSLVVARWLRWIHDRCRQRFWRHKRLLNQLKSQDWDHQAVLAEYQRKWGEKVDLNTPLIVDLCDLAKPRARKLKYLALVRDGSDPDHRLVYGYWCVEVYAYWGKGRITPMLLHPYSIEDPETISENAMILRCVDQVLAATEDRGVIVMDAGADRDNLLIPWIDAQRRFVVRLRGDRHLLLDNGVHAEAAHLAESLLHEQQGEGRIAFRRVYLPERPNRALYLTCITTPGYDRPLILLTSLHVGEPAEADRVLQYYRQRWKCEESARFLKGQMGLERFAMRTYEAFGRLMLIATLTMGLLTWMQLAMPRFTGWLSRKSPGRRKIKFAYYRLMEWFQEQIHAVTTARSP